MLVYKDWDLIVFDTPEEAQMATEFFLSEFHQNDSHRFTLHAVSALIPPGQWVGGVPLTINRRERVVMPAPISGNVQ